MSPLFTLSHRGGSGTPLVCVHGFMDTWRTWELVLPALERRHDVLAPTLPGHAGGPSIAGTSGDAAAAADALERAMDDAGFPTAHIVGNSLGGYLALQLAARGRAESVVALSPAGGWADGDTSFLDIVDLQQRMHESASELATHADAIMETDSGRRRATLFTTENYEHIPAELLAHQLRGVAYESISTLIAQARTERWPLDAERITCPVRIVWGVEDQLLAWPSRRRTVPDRATARGVDRPGRRRPLASARHPVRDRGADPRLHRSLDTSSLTRTRRARSEVASRRRP